MGMKIINDVYTQQQLNDMYPIEPEHRLEEHHGSIRNILAGSDPRMAAIVGPCSVHDPVAVTEYAEKLTRLSEEISDRVFVIMRLYSQKPRTVLGWPGIMHQPNPNEQHNIREGVRVFRELMYKLGKQLPLADEMLYTHNAHPEANFDSMLSYIAVGARDTLGTEHRHLASGLNSVVGMKNPTSGDIKEGVDSVEVAQNKHHLYLSGYHVETDGNEYAHLILRGGKNGSNYGAQSIALADEELSSRKIKYPAIVVDTAHDQIKVNGKGKLPQLMPLVAKSVMLGKREGAPGYNTVKGIMVESFLKEGNQKISPNMEYGRSITDPCLGWEQTEKMMREFADEVDAVMARNQARAVAV